MKRKFEGEKDTKFKGKDKFGRPTLASEEGWTQEKTAEELNISRQAVTKAIQIATAVEEYPELAKEKNGGIGINKEKIWVKKLSVMLKVMLFGLK